MKRVIVWAVVLALIVLTLLGVGVYLLLEQLQPVDSASQQQVEIVVESGETLHSVLPRLEEQKLIRNAEMLRWWARYQGIGSNIQAGRHRLSPAMSGPDIVAALEEQPEQITLTILPGWRLEEIAEYLTGLSLPAYDKDEFLELTTGREGQLAAETYKIAPLSTTETIVDVLARQFENGVKNHPEVQQAMINSEWTWSEIVAIASLLQREGTTAEQMKQIAGVIYNRLADNYPLQIDATVQYALGQDPATGKWWRVISGSDLETASPYNTYQNPGLPPTPISSVSLAAVLAALQPEMTEAYYYLHDPSGQIHFAEDFQQHQTNIETYLR